MLQKIIVNTIILCAIILGLFFFVLFLQPFHSVKAFIDWLSMNKASSFTETYYKTHSLFFIIVSSMILIIGIVSFFLRQKLQGFVGILVDDFTSKYLIVKKSIIHFFKEGWNLHVISFLLVLFAGILNRILYLSYPFRYDEAFTYYSYVKSPSLLSIANYSYPNNHIFHTTLVKLSTFCFGDSLIAIRFPAFLVGILILPLTYVLVRKLYDKNIGLISTAILSCSFPLIDYSVNARGYTLICLFFILLLLFSLKKNRTFADSFWIVLISALGFYTIPVFLYSFVIFLIWIFLKEEKSAKKDLMIYSIGTCIGLLILYTPVFLYTGLNSIIDNDYIVKYDYWVLPKMILLNFINVFSWFSTGFGELAIYIGISGLVLGFFAKNKKANLLILSSILGILFVLLIQRAVPPIRVFLFLVPVVIPFLMHGLFFLINKDKIVASCSLIIVMGFSINVHLKRYSLSDEKSIFEYDKIALQLKKRISKGDQLIAKLPIDYPFEYYLTKHDIPFSFDHVHNGGFSTYDSIHKNVYVMIDTRYNSRPQELYVEQGGNFTLILQESYIEVYQLID